MNKRQLKKITTMMKEGIDLKLCLALILNYCKKDTPGDTAKKMEPFIYDWARKHWGGEHVQLLQVQLDEIKKERDQYAVMLVEERKKNGLSS